MNILLFEDQKVANLQPITLTRPACLISCAGFTLLEAVQHLHPHRKADIRILTRPHVQAITEQLAPGTDPSDISGEVLLLNARLVPHLASIHTLHRTFKKGTPLTSPNGELVALHASVKSLGDIEKILGAHQKGTKHIDVPLFMYPWDVVKYNLEYTKDNLTELAKTGYTEIQPGVLAHASAVVKEFVSFNTETGPIILDENVTVANLVAMRGPIRIRKNATILEHSIIVGPSTIGETCKIRGEVMESIFENYSNKQHYGHIGHSYVGSWVNIGAGTTNSDLKNTYGTIKVAHGNDRINTGMQFLGCIMGDHVKTSINTSIMTGKIIGTGAHCEGTIRDNIPPFTSTYNNTYEQIPLAVTEKIMKRSMKRRGVTFTQTDRNLFHTLYS